MSIKETIKDLFFNPFQILSMNRDKRGRFVATDAASEDFFQDSMATPPIVPVEGGGSDWSR